MSRTKIIATYGPACESDRRIRAMLRGGLDVFRLNLSHLDPADLVATATRLRSIAEKSRIPLAILADMPGPKIRCTVCEPERFEVGEGTRLSISARDGISTPQEIRIPYPYLLEDVKVGHEIAINDGMVLVRVEKVDRRAQSLRGVVVRGGLVGSRKGVSFLHTTLRIRGLTERDRRGLHAAAQGPIDFIALSFVRSSDDLLQARRVLKRAGKAGIPLIAKIEQHEALDRIDEIVAVSDGIMVARGDMGIERPLEEVPLLQKDIIARSNRAGKFVITATQMLESMTESSRPTRAEVTDVANAILDGTDAIMLSAETAMGRDPALVVRTMTRIATVAEQGIDHLERLRRYHPDRRVAEGVKPDLDDALAHAACRLAVDARLDALLCLSFHGSTARRIARYRPRCPTYVLSPHEEQCRRLALTWGVEVFAFPEARPTRSGRVPSPDRLIEPMVRTLRRAGRLRAGHRIAALAGLPLDAPGGTNWLRVVEI
jgi:pyruvate kinase